MQSVSTHVLIALSLSDISFYLDSLVLKRGGLARVTVVARSNYENTKSKSLLLCFTLREVLIQFDDKMKV